MSHEVETMAYRAAEKPWHGLGVPITSDMTTDQMVEIAGLGKRNESEPLYVTSAWYGAGAKLKDEAYKLAIDLVEARV